MIVDGSILEYWPEVGPSINAGQVSEVKTRFLPLEPAVVESTFQHRRLEAPLIQYESRG